VVDATVTYQVILKLRPCNARLHCMLETIFHCEGVKRCLRFGRYCSWNLYGLKDIFKQKRHLFYKAVFEEILCNFDSSRAMKIVQWKFYLCKLWQRMVVVSINHLNLKVLYAAYIVIG